MKERESEDIPVAVRDGLTKVKIGIYGTGHVLNDLAAACWFNYLLYFLTVIVGLSSTNASFVLLSGQIADGIFTPIVGLLSDKYTTRIGKRKPWYIGGTILVGVSFGFMW
jgi:Na+/melibiose symporter-like transporter